MSIQTDSAISLFGKYIKNNYSFNNNQEENYLNIIKDAADICEIKFKNLGYFCGNFTDHGPEHSSRLLIKSLEISDLIKRNYESLSLKEVLIIAVSSFLHDLGMSELPIYLKQENYNKFIEQYKNDYQKMGQILHDAWISLRNTHAESISYIINQDNRIAELLRRLSTTIPFNKEDIPFDLICQSHSSKLLKTNLPKLSHFYRETNIRYPEIAAIILLSDEMDAGYERAPINHPFIRWFPDSTLAHWIKHWYIKECHVNGTNIIIKHINDNVPYHHRKIFITWTVSKIKKEIKMLAEEIFPNSPGWLYKIYIQPEMDPEFNPKMPFEQVTPEVFKIAEEKANVFLNENLIIEEPVWLRNLLPSIDAQSHSSSKMYEELLGPYLA